MVSIIEALGSNYKTISLEDNESIYGGKSHNNEKLKEFMETAEIKETDDYGELCIKLEECGIKAIRPIAHINFEDLANDIIIKKCNEISENHKDILDCYYELKKYDMIYCKNFIDNNINNLHYNTDAEAWYINSMEVLDELWYEHNTLLHPKELIGWVEEYIEDKLNVTIR